MCSTDKLQLLDLDKKVDTKRMCMLLFSTFLSESSNCSLLRQRRCKMCFCELVH